MSEQLPLKQGKIWVEPHDKVKVPTEPIKFNLSDLSREFHFFNHGALFAYGRLRYPMEDPLNDWYIQQSNSPIIVKEAFQTKLFEGLDTLAGDEATWNYILCAVQHECWNSLWAFLCGTAIVDRAANRYCEVFSGDIDILDPTGMGPLAISSDASAARHIPVTVFGIETASIRWEPVLFPATGLVYFNKCQPRASVSGRAKCILDGDVSAMHPRDNQAIETIMQKVRNAH